MVYVAGGPHCQESGCRQGFSQLVKTNRPNESACNLEALSNALAHDAQFEISDARRRLDIWRGNQIVVAGAYS